jgi:hypothetical protein
MGRNAVWKKGQKRRAGIPARIPALPLTRRRKE